MQKSFQSLSTEPDTPLRAQAPHLHDVMTWLQQALHKLEDAKIASVSPATRMDATYDAVLFCCMAIASAEGFRAGNERRHHAALLAGAAHALQLTQVEFNEIDALREWHNHQYRAGYQIELRQVTQCIAIAEPFLEKVGDWFKGKHPALLKKAA